MYSELCRIIIELENKLKLYDQAIEELAKVVETTITSNDQLAQAGDYWMKKAYELKDYVEQLERRIKDGPGLN